MSLIFVDGFDHYASADTTDKYSSESGGDISTVAGEFRSGISALNMDGSNGQVTVAVPNQVTYIVGFGFRVSTSPTLDYRDILTFYEDNAGTGVHVSLGITGNKEFQVIRGVDSVIEATLATTTVQFDLNDGFHYIEFKVTINQTTGSFELKFDEESILTGSGLDTTNNNGAGTAPLGVIKNISFRQVDGAPTDTWYDDLYICDATGTKNNDFLGDCQVITIFPKADGALEDWTPLSGTDSFAMVDENPPDDDTTHVESNVTTEQDSFDMDDVSGMLTILGLQLTLYAKFASGSAGLNHLARVGGSNFIGGDVTLTSAYLFYMNIFEDDPDISSAWTVSGLNAAEFGMEVV